MVVGASERGPSVAPLIEILRPTDLVILAYPRAITRAEADEIKQRWQRIAPELREPLITAGASVLVQRGVEVDIEHGKPGGPELLRIHVPLDPALIATRSPGLIERILDDARVGIEDAFKRWPQ